MKYHKQTKTTVTHPGRGNCFPTAIACMLDMEVADVPNVEVLYDLKGEDQHFWMEVIHKWLGLHGWTIRTADEYRACFHEIVFASPFEQEQYAIEKALYNQYYFGIGKSSRGVNHICIYKNGVLVHDPHPDNTGIEKISFCEIIEAL